MSGPITAAVNSLGRHDMTLTFIALFALATLAAARRTQAAPCRAQAVVVRGRSRRP